MRLCGWELIRINTSVRYSSGFFSVRHAGRDQRVEPGDIDSGVLVPDEEIIPPTEGHDTERRLGSIVVCGRRGSQVKRVKAR